MHHDLNPTKSTIGVFQGRLGDSRIIFILLWPGMEMLLDPEIK